MTGFVAFTSGYSDSVEFMIKLISFLSLSSLFTLSILSLTDCWGNNLILCSSFSFFFFKDKVFYAVLIMMLMFAATSMSSTEVLSMPSELTINFEEI
jgi:hypothetical protein